MSYCNDKSCVGQAAMFHNFIKQRAHYALKNRNAQTDCCSTVGLLYWVFSSMPQLALPNLKTWVFTMSAFAIMNAQFVLTWAAVDDRFLCFRVRGSFLHTPCGCRHVLPLATTGAYLVPVFFLFPLSFPFSIFNLEFTSTPTLWVYENIHKVWGNVRYWTLQYVIKKQTKK